MKSTFTHVGWFLACPVYLEAPESPSPTVVPRHRWLDWWMTVNEVAFGVFAAVTGVLAPTWEPLFPMLITGELDSPIVLTEGPADSSRGRE